MCMNSSDQMITGNSAFRFRRRSSRRYNLRVLVHRLSNRRRKLAKEAKYCRKNIVMMSERVEMEIKNLKLYMENQSIMEENQKLRKKALLLHQENQALFSQLQQRKFSQQNSTTSTTHADQEN